MVGITKRGGAGPDPPDAGHTSLRRGEALPAWLWPVIPYGAGIAAVLTNVNDLAAMGAIPLAIVDTIVGTAGAWRGSFARA